MHGMFDFALKGEYMSNLQPYLDKLATLDFKAMYEGDFFLTWEKTDDEIAATLRWRMR